MTPEENYFHNMRGERGNSEVELMNKFETVSVTYKPDRQIGKRHLKIFLFASCRKSL